MEGESEEEIEVPKPGKSQKYPDPVLERKLSEQVLEEEQNEEVPEKIKPIKPPIQLREDLEQIVKDLPRNPKKELVIPIPKTEHPLPPPPRVSEFCRDIVVTIPRPVPNVKHEDEMQIPSAEINDYRVFPKEASVSLGAMLPPPGTLDDVSQHKPKSGILINEKDQKPVSQDYDSFDLVFGKRPRPVHQSSEKIVTRRIYKNKAKKKKKKRRSRKMDDIPEDAVNAMLNVIANEAMLGEDGVPDELIENYLTKQFRRKVAKKSRTTSYQEADFDSRLGRASEEELEPQSPISEYIQKFRRESEIQKYQQVKKPIRRGTLQSHSYTKVAQPCVREFYFGTKGGSTHQGDPCFPHRNLQGICMPVAAYCFSMLRHPSKWTSENIDEILTAGNNLYASSLELFHLHNLNAELNYNQLDKFCFLGEKKMRFIVDEPEVTGYLFSDNKRIFNLTKALKIFFGSNKAGILKSFSISLAIWKDKFFYVFDAVARKKDMYVSPNGFAHMANFYDIASMVTVLLNRSNYENWPFVIHPIRVLKVMGKNVEDKEDDLDFDSVQSNYNVLSEYKAVVGGTFHLGDDCFGFFRNKQAVAMCAVALVYARITPSSAWHRKTVEKIMSIGHKLCLECLECEAIDDVTVENLPSLFTIGPYVVEIFIYMNRFIETMFDACGCNALMVLDEFFATSTNAIVQIGEWFVAMWKQRDVYFLFDPYSRNSEGLPCRHGVGCVSMHSNTESLIHHLMSVFCGKDMDVRVHALKVLKIYRDPAQGAKFPNHLTMDDYPCDDFKKNKMLRAGRRAIEKPVTVDYSQFAVKASFEDCVKTSIYEIDPQIGSIDFMAIPPIREKIPMEILKPKIKVDEVVVNLDSPSLSDTQISPVRMDQPSQMAEVEFMDLCSYDLTIEESILLEPPDEKPGEEEEGEGECFNYEKFMLEYDLEEGEEGEDDWYLAQSQYAQVGASFDAYKSKMSAQINTDMTFFPIERQVLYPKYIRGKIEMKKRLYDPKLKQEGWDLFYPPEPEVTQSQELLKESNFIDLPDDSQLVRGSKNLAEFGDDVEFMAPFVCIMAATVSRKYHLLTWNRDIIDYILKCGSELYKSSKFRYDQVSKLEIPKISLGKSDFSVLVEYIFDTYMKQNIVEMAITKILFARSDIGILVTPSYACTVFHKNHLFYLYDGFGNNEVGLSEGPGNTGAACLARFKDVKSLAARILFNKRKRESEDDVEYTRFVLSTVRVKTLQDYELMARETRRDLMDYPPEDYIEPEDVPSKPVVKKQVKEPEIKVGYQYKDGVYIIEGSKVLTGRDVVTGDLKEDHFVCICACLMLMDLPVKKWDTRKVDQVIDHGKHVFSHAEDLEVSDKRSIKNVLIEKNFFDIIVRSVRIANPKMNKNVRGGVETLFNKKMSYFLVQFPNACYVCHKSSSDEYFHLFDPYGPPKSSRKASGNKAGWIRCKDLATLKFRLKRVAGKDVPYTFYNFEVTSIRKAPKEFLLSHRMHRYDVEKEERLELVGKPFFEDVEWLKADPIPWSRRAAHAAGGHERGVSDNMWYGWDIEYKKDLFSLLGKIHQTSEKFPEESRGKQTLCNLVVCMGMLDIYDLSEWTSAVIDSVLVNGDHYFMECIADIQEENYELSVDDLRDECTIFPFTFKVTFTPIIEGTMFLVRPNQYNLYKALKFFFLGTNYRKGVICAKKGDLRKHLGFGKLRDSEYFMFDCETKGFPMFLDGLGVAYILRMTTLNRLIHAITLTLRGGDFYIFEVETSDLKPIA